MLKALVNNYPLLFYHMVAYKNLMRAYSRNRPALVATTFLNSQGGRLPEL